MNNSALKSDSQTLTSLIRPTAARRVLLCSALLFVISSAVFMVFKRTDWFPWVGECYPSAKPGHFLAYCHTIRFGDYEHYAFYHESEPVAVEHAKKADVVFLGSSNTQFAFSTDAVSGYFDKLPVAHYVLGFGHGAQSGVAEAVAKKLELAPKVWVVNADPFFTGEINATFERVYVPQVSSNFPLWLQSNIHGEHERKRRLQAEQNSRCSATDNNDIWCRGGADTLHRNELNGHWSVENYRENLQLPVGQDSSSYLDNLDEYAAVALEFMQELNINKRCLIITVTPRTDTPSKFAEALADKIGVHYVAPELGEALGDALTQTAAEAAEEKLGALKTIDGFHLDPASAESWSESFLAELTPYLQNCLEEN